MSEDVTKELTVTIQTDGALMTMTPRSLLDFYLPGATQMPDRPNVWKGRSATGRDCYIQTEVLAGALLDCKEKQLNPVTEIYMIPSTSPDRRASHKVKYSVGLEKLRDMPGFLGINSGLLVEDKSKDVKRRIGRALYPGDTAFGAWAKVYIEGLQEPIEHEVSFEGAEIEGSPVWKDRGSFMIMKVVEDELIRLKVLPRLKPKDREKIDGDEILLEAQPGRAAQQQPKAALAKPEEKKDSWVAGDLYTGKICSLTAPQKLGVDGKPVKGSQAGTITLLFEDKARLTCLFWQAPEALGHVDTWQMLIGQEACLSFKNVAGTASGQLYKFVDTLDLIQPPAAALDPEQLEMPGVTASAEQPTETTSEVAA